MTKRALLIGINYSGTGNALNGCWNDVYDMADFLLEQKFKRKHIKVMTDEEQNLLTDIYPNRLNIIKQITHFIKSAKEGDELFFHYSGHGGEIPDKNKDEVDKEDECIYPVDLKVLVDDTLRQLLVDDLGENISLVCLLDCCHSGTGIDLPYRYQVSKTGNISTECRKVEGDKTVLCISGCKDSQTSADALINKRYNGALTKCFLETIKYISYETTWFMFIIELQKLVHARNYEQIPQLSFDNTKDLAGLVSKLFIIDSKN